MEAAFVRTKDTTPGMALTYALIQMVEKLAEASPFPPWNFDPHVLFIL